MERQARRWPRAPRAGVAALVVGALSLVCGGSGTDVRVVVGDVPERTSSAKTAKLYQQVFVTPSAGEVFELVFEGETDFETGRTHLTGDVLGETLELVTDGPTLYERFDSLKDLTGGKTWLRLGADDIERALGTGDLNELFEERPSDPVQGLQILEGLSGEVETVGPETVRGVDTTHYRVPVDLDKAVSAARPVAHAGLRQLIDRYGVTSMVVYVWIDEEGRARRYQQVVDTTDGGTVEPAAGLPRSVATTVEMYDFGAPVDIAVPPAGEVARFSDVFGDAAAAGPDETAETLELAALLVDAPAGYLRVPDASADAGPSTLDKAIDDDGEPDARDALTDSGFMAGYQRAWNGGSGPILEALYEFTSPAGAVAYGDRALASSLASGSAVPFAVEEIPGGQGFAITGADGTAHLVHFTAGRYMVEIVGIGGADLRAVVVKMARDQYALL